MAFSLNRGKGREALEQTYVREPVTLEEEHQSQEPITVEASEPNHPISLFDILSAKITYLDVQQSLNMLEAFNTFYNSPSTESFTYCLKQIQDVANTIASIEENVRYLSKSKVAQSPEYQAEMAYLNEVVAGIQQEMDTFIENVT